MMGQFEYRMRHRPAMPETIIKSSLPSRENPEQARRLSIAPMLDWTDRHYRVLARLITRHALLYTEMVTTGALLHGDAARHLNFHPDEHPLALQLGGSEPAELACCTRLADDWGYDEINLNVGCPSNRVQFGRFGACLMAEPALVGDCVAAMQAVTAKPVTVKCRIGIDEQEDYEPLAKFVETVADAGCEVFVIHARKAWLKGLSPKENRDVPPLRYEMVHRIKAEFPALRIVINGGIRDLTTAEAQLQQLDGVMIGREAYQNPWMLAQADRRIFADPAPPPDRWEVAEGYAAYIEARLAEGVPLNAMTKHSLGLFNGLPGARKFRRYLSENATVPGAGADVFREAISRVRRPSEHLESTPSQ